MAHSSRQIPPTCLTSYIFAIRLDPHRLNNPEKLFCSADKLPLAFRTLLLRWTSGPPPPPRPPPPQDSSSFACWHPQQPFRTSLEASANQTTLQMIKGRSRRRRERRRGKRRNGCHFVIKVPLTPEGANWTLPACGSSSRRRRRRRRRRGPIRIAAPAHPLSPPLSTLEHCRVLGRMQRERFLEVAKIFFVRPATCKLSRRCSSAFFFHECNQDSCLLEGGGKREGGEGIQASCSISSIRA